MMICESVLDMHIYVGTQKICHMYVTKQKTFLKKMIFPAGDVLS